MATQQRNIRLIVTDIDNTILRSNGTISSATEVAFARAAAAGIPTVLASSRTAEVASHVVTRVGDLRYMIMLTGCRVVDMRTGELLYHRYLERETARALVRYFTDQDDCYVEICSGGKYLIPEKAMAYISAQHVFDHYLKDLRPGMELLSDPADWLTHTDAPVDKLFFYARRRERFQQLYDELPSRSALTLVSPVPMGIDVLPHRVNKGEALRALLTHLRIPPEQVVVFGDSENDADMFLPGAYKVAVGNAYPSLKDLADHVTLANDEDGVAIMLNHILECKDL